MVNRNQALIIGLLFINPKCRCSYATNCVMEGTVGYKNTFSLCSTCLFIDVSVSQCFLWLLSEPQSMFGEKSSTGFTIDSSASVAGNARLYI